VKHPKIRNDPKQKANPQYKEKAELHGETNKKQKKKKQHCSSGGWRQARWSGAEAFGEDTGEMRKLPEKPSEMRMPEKP
jgi:hypothetical protein